MSLLLIETIRFENGELRNFEAHRRRMQRSARELFGPGGDGASLELWGVLDELRLKNGPAMDSGRWKLRVVYGQSVELAEAVRYRPPRFESVALIDGNGLDYGHKFADRRWIDALSRCAELVGADTALIAAGGRITDFSYANAAFFDGKLWWTPRRPLLPGTARAVLVREGKLIMADLKVGDLRNFECCSPVNAMLDLGELRLNTNKIIGLD